MWPWRRICKNQTEHKARKELMERIGEERALIHLRAHNKKQRRNGLATSWKETFNALLSAGMLLVLYQTINRY